MEIKNLNELENFAQDFLKNLKPKIDRATIVGLKGNLGSGKTTFTQIFAKLFGITETVNSPTFVIEKKYKISDNQNFDTLIHIDAYRLESGKELEVLDWKEISTNPKNLILIEWPEKVSDILKDVHVIEFEYINESERKINVQN